MMELLKAEERGPNKYRVCTVRSYGLIFLYLIKFVKKLFVLFIIDSQF